MATDSVSQFTIEGIVLDPAGEPAPSTRLAPVNERRAHSKVLTSRMRLVEAAVTILALVGASACGGGSASELQLRDGWAPPPVVEPSLADDVAQLRAQAVSFDPSAEVGTIPGSSGITPSGQATYSIPLTVARGVGAMTPELSLEYRSTTHNGPLGVGFSLGGLAAPVRRCDRTLAIDGISEAYAFELDDALCWGGDRLVLEKGDYGQDGAQYRTRHDPFAKIVQHAGTNARDSYFEVFTKDGSILVFGHPEASLVRTIDATPMPWMWGLRSAADRYDNVVDYRYDAPKLGVLDDPYELRLREIAYGGTGAEASRRHIRFDYQGRPDESWGFAAGVQQGRMARLWKITAEGPQGELVASYELLYEQDPASNQSRIASISKCDGSHCLPPSEFTWSDPGGLPVLGLTPYGTFMGPDAELVDDPVPFASSPTRLVGDFDGDADHDLLYFTDAGWRAWDGSSQYDLLDTPVVVPWPTLLPQGDAYVEGLMGGVEGDAYVDRLQPAFSISVIDANGDLRDDLLVPRRPLAEGSDQVDAWGYRFAEDVVVAVASTPEGQLPDVGFTEPVAFVEELAGLAGDPIYTVVPLDHDGDGLSDLWLCQGSGYKSGHWILAHRVPHPSGASGLYAYSAHDSGVGCSVHDELLVTSLRGGRQDLLVVPAYETGPAMPRPGDFFNSLAYYHDYLPRPEDQRTEYLALSFEIGGGPGVLEPTGLPRDHYQRWHDRLCRNGLARELYGRPLAGAGLGLDKLADINGDGLVDVLRFELDSGDAPGNPDLQLGIDGDFGWSPDLLCTDSVEVDIPAHIQSYLNTGDGFVPGPAVHDFTGNPHANLWLNYHRAQLYDFNLDGIADLLLPSSGAGGSWTAVVSKGDGTYGDQAVALPSGWPAYSVDSAWRDQMKKAETVQVMTLAPALHERGQITFLGYVEDNPAQWPYLINTLSTNYSDPHNRVIKITDGLGAVTKIDYTQISPGGNHGLLGMHGYPRTGPKGAMPVVTRHSVQSNPQGDFETDQYAYHDAVVDAWGGGLLGFAEVERWSEGEIHQHTWIHYEFERDDALGEYPTAGRPLEILDQRRVVRDDGSPEYWLTRTRQQYETVVEARAGGPTMFTYPSHQDVEVFVRDESCLDDCDPMLVDRFQWLTVEQERDDLGTVLSTTTTSAVETRTYEVEAMLDDRDAWLVGRALSWIETSCTSDECGERTQTATYDPTTGAVLTSTFAPDEPVARVDTSHEYDAYGNVLSTTIADLQGDVRTTMTTWDAEGIYPESMTNAAGHTSWVIHHPASGVPVAEVAADGVTWVHRYDGLLRPTRHERRATPLGLSDGNVTTLEYAAGGSVHDETFKADSALRVRTTDPDGQEVTIDYGATMQPMQHAWWGMESLDEVPYTLVGPGGEVYQSTLYDPRGRVRRESLPTWATEQPAGYTTTSYDGASRVVAIEHPHGTIERFDHGTLSAGLQVQHTDEHDVVTRTQTDAASRVVVTIDALGTSTCFTYGPFDVVREVRRDCNEPETPWISTFEHDVAGRITFESDPAFDQRSYAYNGFGEVIEVTDADGEIVTFDHDDLGRLLSRHDADGDTTHTYDVGRLGRLHSSESPDDVVLEYAYDASGRLGAVAMTDLLLTVPGALELHYDYGVGDRLESLVYPSVDGDPEVRVDYHYDDIGNLRRVERANGELLWSALEADEAGRLMRERFGNGLDTQRTYEPLTGRPTSVQTVGESSAVQSLAYAWHPWGELESRSDLLTTQQEAFEYDDLRRLTTATVTHGMDATAINVSYDAVGNILGKSDVGGYVYFDGRLIAYGTGFPVLLGHDGRGNVETHGDQTLTYTPFDKLRQLDDGAQTLDFRYDAEGNRFSRHSAYDDELIVAVRGLYERRVKQGALELTYRVPAAGRVVAQIVRTPDLMGGWDTAVESLHDDHIGSTHVVTNATAAVEHSVSHDPWGRAREADDWTTPLDADDLEDLGVGFTGHPARLDAGLVDMGGRSYHPMLGRFFSPDPLVTGPFDAQAYNRYSYVQNRPLVATDPTGYAPQGLGDDGRIPGKLGETCEENGDCSRLIIVSDPDAGSSAYDSWQRASAMFDAYNGLGQGGPGGGGGNPYSPNGVRHGDDSGQPGGSPAFTIRVTQDMCAEIAACSGRMSKRGPVYIWDAPIDSWAKTAADVATDFIPGVSQAKTAYDAYERIQNGEDPVEVLAAAAGEAALGLVPGLRVGNKARKALRKADNVADAVGDLRHATNKGPKALAEKAGPTGHISPSEVAGKSPAQIDARARELGLQPRGSDPAHGAGSYIDPQTNTQRMLSHPHTASPHGHVNNPAGQRIGPDGSVVDSESAAAHLPIRVE